MLASCSFGFSIDRFVLYSHPRPAFHCVGSVRGRQLSAFDATAKQYGVDKRSIFYLFIIIYQPNDDTTLATYVSFIIIIFVGLYYVISCYAGLFYSSDDKREG